MAEIRTEPRRTPRGATPFKQIRESQGRTQVWVARQLGISKARLCELENNYTGTRITVDELRKLANLYGTTIDTLVGGTNGSKTQARA